MTHEYRAELATSWEHRVERTIDADRKMLNGEELMDELDTSLTEAFI